ncbi:MAG: hypothetical protein QW687_01610 [Candidatus Hadarchaeales archaeon]
MIDLAWVVNIVLSVSIGTVIGSLLWFWILEKVLYRRRRKWVGYLLDGLFEEIRNRSPEIKQAARSFILGFLDEPKRTPEET